MTDAPTTVMAPAPGAPTREELQQRRVQLARRIAELQFDLGGLAYEMAIRDHFRLDTLTRRAAELQRVDGELAELDRLMSMEQASAVGACPTCGALHSRGAVFCWQCGTQLLPTGPAGE
ncbi:MAG: hypothetical protein ACSLFR_16270 [Solirubrobacteraceae bacterium]